MVNIDLWGIDIFAITTLTNNKPLTAVCYTIFQVKFNPNIKFIQIRKNF